jgi:hypothetical protein
VSNKCLENQPTNAIPVLEIVVSYSKDFTAKSRNSKKSSNQANRAPHAARDGTVSATTDMSRKSSAGSIELWFFRSVKMTHRMRVPRRGFVRDPTRRQRFPASRPRDKPDDKTSAFGNGHLRDFPPPGWFIPGVS